jgi:hypothetical protein
MATPVLNRLVTCQKHHHASACRPISHDRWRLRLRIHTRRYRTQGELEFHPEFQLGGSRAGHRRRRPGGAGGLGNCRACCGLNRLRSSGVLSLFDAVKRQLGLKLGKVRRPVPVLAIDHIDEHPTEN